MTNLIVISSVLFAIAFSLMIWYSKNLVLKLVTITLLFFISNIVYFGLDSYKGWPTNESMPKKGSVVWVSVNEPNENYSGAIYLWITYEKSLLAWPMRLFDYSYDDKLAPRAFRLPYSKSLAEKVKKVGKYLENGIPVDVEMDEDSDSEGTIEKFEKNNTPTFKLVDPRDILRKDAK